MTGRVLAVAAAVALAGGSTPREPTPQPNRGEWADVRDAATRQFKLYDGLIHRADAIVTYLSPQVREARARRLADWFAWTPADLQRRLADEEAESDRFDDFVLALYTADRNLNELDTRRTQWRISLEVSGGQMTSREVHALDVDSTVSSLFPYVGVFDVVYVVRFARVPGALPLEGRPFVLRLSSGYGQLPLDFGAPPRRLEIFRQAP